MFVVFAQICCTSVVHLKSLVCLHSTILGSGCEGVAFDFQALLDLSFFFCMSRGVVGERGKGKGGGEKSYTKSAYIQDLEWEVVEMSRY